MIRASSTSVTPKLMSVSEFPNICLSVCGAKSRTCDGFWRQVMTPIFPDRAFESILSSAMFSEAMSSNSSMIAKNGSRSLSSIFSRFRMVDQTRRMTPVETTFRISSERIVLRTRMIFPSSTALEMLMVPSRWATIPREMGSSTQS